MVGAGGGIASAGMCFCRRAAGRIGIVLLEDVEYVALFHEKEGSEARGASKFGVEGV